MESLYPAHLMSNSNWFVQERHNSEWSREENKKFESALAIYDEDTPDRWLKVAAMIPGKTVYDVIKQYRELEEDVSEIEAGRVPIPGYPHSYDDAHRRRPPTSKGCDHERKKGVPWTEEEHRRFLMGLLKYGKGDWRNISRNFVVTKTPTQVASHAQKYFIRQKLGGGGKDKRRPSIHDITIANHTESTKPDMTKPLLFNHSPMLTTTMPKAQLYWNHHVDEYGSLMVFNPNLDRVFRSSPSVMTSKSLDKPQGQDLYDYAFHEAYKDLQNPSFRTAPIDFNKESVYGIHAL